MRQLMILALGISMVLGSTDAHAFFGKKVTEVDYSDGVSKKEAVFLAKQYILENNMRDSLYGWRPYKISSSTHYCDKSEDICTPSDMTQIKGYEDVNIEKEVWVLFYRNKCCSLLWGAIPFMPTLIAIDKNSGHILSAGVLK